MFCTLLLQCCAAFLFNGVGVTAAHCEATLPKHTVISIDRDSDVLCFDPAGYNLPTPTEGVTTLGAKLIEHTAPGYLRFDRDVVGGNSGSGIIVDRVPIVITHRYDESNGTKTAGRGAIPFCALSKGNTR